MIEVDYRVGSVELAPALKRLVGAANVRVGKFEAADYRFSGNGPDGRVMVGIERKRIGDLISSIHSKRLDGFQMKNLRDDYDRIYLLVEGYWKPGRQGELESYGGYKRRGLLSYSEPDNFLTAAQEAGVRVKRTSTDVESVHVIADLWRWWQKPWKEHRSQASDALYLPLPGKPGMRPSLVVKMAAQIDGISSAAWKYGPRFALPSDMCAAPVEKLMVKGKISRKRAEVIARLLRGTI